MGMITLLQGLGSPDSFKQIGPSMGMAMVATMYGIAVANLVLIPLGENLSKLNKKEFLNRNIVIDGIKLLRSEEHPLVVEETLNSYLLPGERSETQVTAA
jgi:chemotaxis protein MotA